MNGSGPGRKTLRGRVRTRSQALGLWVPLLLEARIMGRRESRGSGQRGGNSFSQRGMSPIHFSLPTLSRSIPCPRCPLPPWKGRKCLSPSPPPNLPALGPTSSASCSASSHLDCSLLALGITGPNGLPGPEHQADQCIRLTPASRPPGILLELLSLLVSHSR